MIDVIFAIIRAALGLIAIILITQEVLSWLIAFQVATGGAIVQIYRALTTLTDPMVRPIRRLIPPVSGIDLSLLVLLFVIGIVQGPLLSWIQGLFHGGSILYSN